MAEFILSEYLKNRLEEQFDKILSETATADSTWAAKVRINELVRLAANASLKVEIPVSVIKVITQ